MAGTFFRGAKAFFNHGHVVRHGLVNFSGAAIGIIHQSVQHIAARRQHMFHFEVELVDRLINQGRHIIQTFRDFAAGGFKLAG